MSKGPQINSGVFGKKLKEHHQVMLGKFKPLRKE